MQAHHGGATRTPQLLGEVDLRRCRPEWGKWRWAQLSWRELLRHWHRLWMGGERYLRRQRCLQLGLERQLVVELGDWQRWW